LPQITSLLPQTQAAAAAAFDATTTATAAVVVAVAHVAAVGAARQICPSCVPLTKCQSGIAFTISI